LADWYLVPCLVHMRAEWNTISPRRDKGADGSIGDAAHASGTSDHNPDPQGRVLALDIDSTGPWPGGFDHFVQRVVARQKSGADNRLEYVIWNRRIASRSSGWVWKTYTGSSDPHTGHAHFSARHDHTGNTSTAAWHIDDEEELPVDQATFNKLMDGWAATDKGKAAFAAAWSAGFGPETNRETAGGRLAHVDEAVDDILERLPATGTPANPSTK
jgi:hypothetical protein